MSPTREQIFTALFALTNGVTWVPGEGLDPVGFIQRTRRIKLFSDVPTEMQPWLGQAEHGENFVQVTKLPYKRTYQASWIVYHATGLIPDDVPTITNNLILDALQAAIAPKPSDPGFLDDRNTLSGLVHHCYIEGEVFKDPGDIDNQAMIVVPIRILVP